jgi:Uma2 family endonuclease
MARKPTQTENRIVLPNVNWQKLEAILQDLGATRTARFAYDRGKLEMMTPLEEHDRCNRLIESLILVLTEEVELTVKNVGSVLLKRADLGRAIQPDAGYYFGHEPVRVRNSTELDMNLDPAPDLAVEVSMTKSTLDVFALYAEMGVPEVWQYVTVLGDDVLKGKLGIYQLRDGRYAATPNSLVFPCLPAERVLEFLEQSDKIGLAQALIVLRSWIKQTLG